MIIAEWSVNVPKEKMEEFLRHSKEVLKPFWESHGTSSYSAYRCIPDKRYFSYQEEHDENRIVEHYCFDDIKDFERFLETSHTEGTEEYEMQSLYMGRFHVTDVVFRIYKSI